MLRFTTLIQALLIAVSVAPVAQTYLISNKVVIWNEWQPFPEAEEHLKQLVINASISKIPFQEIPPTDAYHQFFKDMEKKGRFSGEKANRPMSGTEWNIWYTDIVKRRYEAENQAIAASAGRAR
ncbi:uncharacterized protein SPSC_06632 [Sporisorium scitamineum]|uniref:Uncharacterized protein n=1 Tax=Sporisorium scitamineum TaxID=49012 RepID=A0A140KNR3_9BASI|nr:uncharacterized protein SPSC_06632 [Sporisorium scitamineum]